MIIKSSSKGRKIKEDILSEFKDSFFEWDFEIKDDVNRKKSEREKQIRAFYLFLKDRYDIVVRGIESNFYIDDLYSKDRWLTLRSDKDEKLIKEIEEKFKKFMCPDFIGGLQLSFATKNKSDDKINIFLFLSKIYYSLSFRSMSEIKENIVKLKTHIKESNEFVVYFINDLNFEDDLLKHIKIMTIKRKYLGLVNNSDKGRAPTLVKGINGESVLLETEAINYFEDNGLKAVNTDDYRGEYRFLFSKEKIKDKEDIPREILNILKEKDINFDMGVPDLLIWDPKDSKNFFFCEVKSQKDKLSHFQVDWINAHKNRVKIKILKIENAQ